MDVPARLTVALFVVFAPSVLFLGLWYGLTSLRDDDLAGEVTTRQLRGLFDTLPSGQPSTGRFEGVHSRRIETASPLAPSGEGRPPGGRSEIEIGVESDPTECERCEEPNPPSAELCWGCGAYLNGVAASE